MTTLIIETSTEKSFTSLGGETIWLEKQSTDLLPALQRLLEKKKATDIAVGTGPGSYTGTRIGTTTAKMLAFALDLPIRTFPSLAAFGDKVAFTAHSRGFYLYNGSEVTLEKHQPKFLVATPHPEKLNFPAKEALPCPERILKYIEGRPHVDPVDVCASYIGAP